MKITSTPRTGERPALSGPSSNTGIAPKNTGIVPAKKSRDGFETARASSTTRASVSGNTGIVGPGSVKGRATVNTDFKLSANLEPFRGLFDKAGTRISKLPTAEKRESAIQRLTNSFFKRLGGIASKDEIRGGLGASTEARLAYRPQDIDDPQYCSYKADAMLETSPKLKGLTNALKGIGLPIAHDTTIQTRKDILKAAKPQLNQLGLKGQDKKTAKDYIVALVAEERARLAAAATGTSTGTGQLKLPQTVRP